MKPRWIALSLGYLQYPAPVGYATNLHPAVGLTADELDPFGFLHHEGIPMPELEEFCLLIVLDHQRNRLIREATLSRSLYILMGRRLLLVTK